MTKTLFIEKKSGQTISIPMISDYNWNSFKEVMNAKNSSKDGVKNGFGYLYGVKKGNIKTYWIKDK